MGSRTVFELSDAGDADVPPNVVLFADSSHPTEDPRQAFHRIGAGSSGPNQMLEALLAARYETKGGDHRAGDRMFSLVEGAYGHCDAVHTAHWGFGTTCRLATSDEVPTLASLRPGQVEALSRVVLLACRGVEDDGGFGPEATRAFEARRDDAVGAVGLLERVGADVSEHRKELGLTSPTGPGVR